ncbi:hypothetical protein B0H10DRAFT_2243885 [Mycena sp. CBHHK59/15]|nr:hypothetical protein B0H10DRAFT_2243885 [Mycena sp. CBHHK59/15]
MCNCISLRQWKAYSHCLSPLVPSLRALGVANGGRVWPHSRWFGEVSVGGVQATVWFEVFPCDEAFDIILGKPWLHSVRAIHNYETNEIWIRTVGQETVLQNKDRRVIEQEEDAETAKEKGPEEVWREEEIAQIERKKENEKQRKAEQLFRRAEQPLPFPGLGYSPPPHIEPKSHSPHPFPAQITGGKPPTPIDGVGNIGEETGADEQLEDEWEHINLIQTSHAPWAESRFAKYLTVDPLPESDALADEDPVEEAITARELDWRQREKLQQQHANLALE